MAKQDQIPTTQFVPKYQNDATKQQQDVWFTAVAGFCNGAQALKLNGDIASVRIGAMVFMEGSFIIDGVITTINIMPVVPRNNGFLSICSEDGTISALKFDAGSKEISVDTLTAGTYLVNGSYIANQKEYK